MLDDFLTSNRDEIIAGVKTRIAARQLSHATGADFDRGIPAFVTQLGAALRRALATPQPNHDDIESTAGEYGGDLFRLGLTVEQVVHGYGDVCQVVTELAMKHQLSIAASEFRTLNLCLDDAIASAVAEFGRDRDRRIVAAEAEWIGALNEQLEGVLDVAAFSFDSIRKGLVGPGGSTGDMHAWSLEQLRDLVANAFAAARLQVGTAQVERVGVQEWLADVERRASVQARAKAVSLAIAAVDPALGVHVDRAFATTALRGLLRVAFDRAPRHGEVSLTTKTTADRVLVVIRSGGDALSPAALADLADVFAKPSASGRSVDVGTSISAKAANACGGTVTVENVPNQGCVLTLALPLRAS